jgi:hypothetical protein
LLILPQLPRWLDEPIQLTAPQWTSILHLSHMWSFFHIRARAISELNTLLRANDDYIQRIQLGQKYEIPTWALHGYSALVERKKPLSVEEGVRLGAEDTVRVGLVREKRLKMQIALCEVVTRVSRQSGSLASGDLRSKNEQSKSKTVLRRDIMGLVKETFGL